jgi:uncharacterized membrane protein YfcA
MHFDAGVAAAGLVGGFVVGLTGMGGGALMTPMLVLVFGVQPLAAVSSDLVASVIMKPVGASVHLRRGTVHTELVRWLVIGSVPSAFLGVIILKHLGHGESVQHNLKVALGVALLVACTSIVAKSVLQLRRPPTERLHGPLAVKRGRTMLIGVIGGLVVGMTSVGSGSLMIVMLLLLYPMLSASELVGTDLVQAIPLVASAALGHLLFGDFKLGLTTSLLVGCLPGVYVGARVSARAPDRVIRPALVFVLLASALKLLGVSNVVLGVVLFAAVATGIPAFLWLSGRRRHTAGP